MSRTTGKRFLLFIVVEFVERGGMHELYGSFDTLEQCRETLIASHVETISKWEWHIYDTVSGAVFAETTEPRSFHFLRDVRKLPDHLQTEIPWPIID